MADTKAAEQRVRETLRAWKQHHVLQRMDADINDELLPQLVHFESWYPHGLDGYLTSATELFASLRRDNQSGPTDSVDAFALWTPSVPHDANGVLSVESPRLQELEDVGLDHVQHCAFVVVAGGLGERLGYNGIKLALPVETVTRTSYLETYVAHIKALQVALALRGHKDVTIPLAIMTSDATHDATATFLRQHDWFNMPDSQLSLIKQDMVPCVDAASSAGGIALHLVLDQRSGRLVMKPHGHGDVHTLLHTSGLAERWLRQDGKRFVHFIQDTNALILNTTLPLLGATATNKWSWGFTVVPRKAKDASGAIVQFTPPDSSSHTNATALFNVEYHELDHFLRTKAGDQFADGDSNDTTTKFSPFPGNINHCVAQLETYVAVLNESRGKTPEIFNPKFQPNHSGLFKSPARLECMMQDFPKLIISSNVDVVLPRTRGIGLLSFPSSLVYSPCKNDTASAAAKLHADIPPQCACSAEHDMLALNRAKLTQLGVGVTASNQDRGGGITGARSEWLGIPVPDAARGPHVVWTPAFGYSLAALASHFPQPQQVHISSRSTLVIAGEGAHNLTISSMHLDGALKIVVADGARVSIQCLQVVNDGFAYTAVDAVAGPVDAMRGYRLAAKEIKELDINEPGEYQVLEDGSVVRA